MNSPWIVADLEQALQQLEQALATPGDIDLIKAGRIQYFEFCFELAWKSIKLAARDAGLEDCMSPKGCLKQAFALGWISDDAAWLEMLEARNQMSHTYDAKRALELHAKLPRFYQQLKLLLNVLKGL